MSYLVNANVTYTLLCAQASKFNEKLFPERSDEEESRILVKFREGDGPDKEDVKMFGRAFLKLKRNRDQIVELHHLSLGNYHSERVIVFCSVMLQRDRRVHKGCDIRRLLERCMKLWRDEQYDVLLQEAIHCDQSLRNSHRRPSSRDSKEHLIKVFTRLMLEGNVRAAVRWLTERSGGGVLKPSDTATIGGTSMTVLEVLGLKHPDPCTPPDWVLASMDNLPYFEDSEITGSHILSITHQLQGGAGPGGCDASHWRDVLLRYGTSSAHLCDSVAGLCRHLCNSIVPWDSVRALVASCLIALDKCPGVRLIGIGETLRRIIGKAVCLATRLDATLVCGSDQLCFRSSGSRYWLGCVTS